MCRQLVKALQGFVDVKSMGQVTAQIARMFNVACEAVKAGDIPDKPSTFWGKVSQSVGWMKTVDGENLQSFAMKVLTARVTAMKAADEAEEMGLDLRAEELKAATKLTVAVDNYTRLLPIQYSYWVDLDPSPVDLTQMGRRAVLPANYLDWWVEDPHNQGSEADTLAYKALLEGAGSLAVGKKPPGQEKAEKKVEKKEEKKEEVKEEEKKKIDEGKAEAGDVDMDREEEGVEEEDGYDSEDSEDPDYLDFLDMDSENKWAD